MSESSPGRQLKATADSAAWHQLEQQLGLAEQFSAVDGLTARLLHATLRGTDVVVAQLATGRESTSSAQLYQVGDAERAWLDEHMTVSAHQARGGWWLPEQVTLNVGLCNLASLTQREGRFGVAAAVDMTAKLDASSADALFATVVLQPVLEAVLAPLVLRSGAAGKQLAPRQKAWAEIDDLYADLGLNGGQPLETLKPRPVWRSLTPDQQDDARQALLIQLVEQVTLMTVQRLRARQLRQLIDALYGRSKPGKVMPLARSILTKARQPYLAAWFGSDWLAFLSWLGEQPNPGEQLLASLPETELIVAQPGQASSIAVDTGLSIADIDAILMSFAGTATAAQQSAATAAAGPSAAPSGTPVADRVATIADFWAEFDTRHTAQRSGMPALWGLVDEGFYNIGDTQAPPRLHRQLLSPALNTRIDDLWQGTCLKRYPERVVSEPHPHKQMADAAGPALAFWHGVALTCWYICEGPFSRTDLPGLRHYHRRELEALESMGTPIPEALFEDLKAAERRLGPIQEVRNNLSSSDVGHGITVELSTIGGTRRAGFEILRDVVTVHRRQWTETHLPAYLEQRWRDELLAIGREFHRRLAGRGKPPTHKQFAEFAADAANHWFNGDLSGLYLALGQRPPAASRRVDLLPGDAYDMCWQTYRNLGGTPYSYDRISHPEKYGRHWELGRLCAGVPKYLQLWEALDRPPSQREFGAQSFNWPWPGGVDEGWPEFSQAIVGALDTAERHFSNTAAASAPQPTVDRQPTPAAWPEQVEVAVVPSDEPQAEARGLRRLFRRS